MASVLIAIQARSGSKRLPGKSLKLIDDTIMVQHVVNACKSSALHLNRTEGLTKVFAKVVVLIPEGDPLKDELSEVDVMEGPEHNVLERYNIAYKAYKPDYICRITGDCPLIIPTIITKHVVAAVARELDYVSNAYEHLRTFIDGYDCEVISKHAFDWLVRNAYAPQDLEHVTTLLRKEAPKWAKFGVVMAHTDLSDIKCSVDTLEDFDDVVKRKRNLDHKYRIAKDLNYVILRF